MKATEAEKKTCPFIRELGKIEDTIIPIHHSNCRTVNCMAWKWEEDGVNGYCQLIERRSPPLLYFPLDERKPA